MLRAYDLSVREAGPRQSFVWDQPGLHSNFQGILSYIMKQSVRWWLWYWILLKIICMSKHSCECWQTWTSRHLCSVLAGEVTNPLCNLDSFLFKSQTKPKFIQSGSKERRSPPREKESGDRDLESCWVPYGTREMGVPLLEFLVS